MDLIRALGATLRPHPGATIVAFAGAGGKTSAMFALAESAASCGLRVIVTTTTRIRDPRLEGGRRYAAVFIGRDPTATPEPAPGGLPVVAAAGALETEGKLEGFAPNRISALASKCDLLLVEADGARGKSVKAPAAHEPALPDDADIVVGVVGLDCLGKALGPEIAHRHETLGPLVGCEPGGAIEPRHVAALAAAEDGLFKGSPPEASRVILLNKSDAAPARAIAQLVDLLEKGVNAADRLVVCSLAESRIDAAYAPRKPAPGAASSRAADSRATASGAAASKVAS